MNLLVFIDYYNFALNLDIKLLIFIWVQGHQNHFQILEREKSVKEQKKSKLTLKF
jgi:hypothetical protein